MMSIREQVAAVIYREVGDLLDESCTAKQADELAALILAMPELNGALELAKTLSDAVGGNGAVTFTLTATK